MHIYVSVHACRDRQVCGLSLLGAKVCSAGYLSRGSRALQGTQRSGTRQVPPRRAARDARRVRTTLILRASSGSDGRAHHLTTLDIIRAC